MPDAASGKLAMVERQLVGNIHAAARALGISRATLYRKMRKHKFAAR
jgi:transcriptional regulator of acetoin/glycerol metabolism